MKVTTIIFCIIAFASASCSYKLKTRTSNREIDCSLSPKHESCREDTSKQDKDKPKNSTPPGSSNPTPKNLEASLTGTYFNTPQNLELSSSDPNDKIYYTLDGSNPTTTSNLYSGPIVINSSVVVKAVAVGEDGASSDVMVFTYVIDSTPPTVGSTNAPAGASSTGFTLSWSAATDNEDGNLSYFVCSGASAQDIDTVEECLTAIEEMPFTANKTSLVISNKAPSTTYYYNVVVKDAAGNYDIYSGITASTSADTTAPSVGSFTSASNITLTGLTLNWTAATDDHTSAAQLEYYVCSASNAASIDEPNECEIADQEMDWTANITSTIITGKDPMTTYYFNVLVKDSSGNTGVYTPTSVTTSADSTSPTAGSFAASTSITNNGFTLNWSAGSDNYTATNSLSYYLCSGSSAAAINTVEKCLDDVTNVKEMDWAINTLTKAISGKSANTTFYYNVVVRDAAGNKTLYEGKSETTSNAQQLTITATSGTFKLGLGSFTSVLSEGSSANAVETALEGVYGAGNVSVSGHGTNVSPYLVTFQGALSGQDIDQMNGTDNVTVTTNQAGGGAAGTVTVNAQEPGSMELLPFLEAINLSGFPAGSPQPMIDQVTSVINARKLLSSVKGTILNMDADFLTVEYSDSEMHISGNIHVWSPAKSSWEIRFGTNPDYVNYVYLITATWWDATGSILPATVSNKSDDSAIEKNVNIWNGGSLFPDSFNFPAGTANSVHSIVVDAASGNYTLSNGVTTTSPIAWNANAVTLQTALEAVYGAGNVSVTGNGTALQPFLVEFTGSLAGQTVAASTVDDSNLFKNVTNEVQAVTVDASSGSFRLIGNNTWTSDLAYNITSQDLQTALENLAPVGAGNISVTGNGTALTPFLIEFIGSLVSADMPPFVPDGTLLGGGTIW